MRATRSLHLVVPGLLGPVTDPDTVARISPRMPALERLLGRATVSERGQTHAEACILSACGIRVSPAPVAAVARLGEPDAPALAMRDWWLRVDPVHLRVDMNQARLFGPHALKLEAEHARGLVARLNEHLADDGLSIEAPVPDRWYLQLPGPPDLETHSLAEVSGRNVHLFMPTGGDSARWRSWLTEVQMLLHDAPENAERERAGQLPVNSVWPWGGGRLPATAQVPGPVIASDPLTIGASRLADNGDPVALAEANPDAGFDGRCLVVESGAQAPLIHGEVEGWLETVSAIERDWAAPLLKALRDRRLDRLELDPCDGRCFVLSRSGLARFWRRDKGWYQWLREENRWR